MKTTKIFLFAAIAVATVIVFFSFINKFMSNSKAALEKIYFEVTPSEISMALGEKKDTSFIIKSEDFNNKISGIDLTFRTEGPVEITSVLPPADFPPTTTNTNVSKNELRNEVNGSSARASYAFIGKTDDLSNIYKMVVTVKSVGQGTGRVYIDTSQSEIVGNVPGSAYDLGTGAEAKVFLKGESANQPIQISFSPDGGFKGIGQTFPVYLRILSYGKRVSGFDITAKYDPKILKVINLSSPQDMVNGYPSGPTKYQPLVSEINSNAGTVRLSYVSTLPSTSLSTDLIVSMMGEAITLGKSTLSIPSGQVVGPDSQQDYELNTSVSSILEVSQNPPSPTTTTGPTPAPWELTPTPGIKSSPTPTSPPYVTQPAPTNPISRSALVIYAAGTPSFDDIRQENVYPNIDVIINGAQGQYHVPLENIKGDPEKRIFAQLPAFFSEPLKITDIKIAFVNDVSNSSNGDRNLMIDKVVLDGREYQTEAENTYSTGSWGAGGCAPGFKRSEWLYCNGFFQYGIQNVSGYPQRSLTPTMIPEISPLPTIRPGKAILSLNRIAVEANLGDTFNVDVLIDSQNEQVMGVDSYLTFNSNNIQVVRVTNGGLFQTVFNDISPDKLYIGSVMDDPSKFMKGFGKIATVTFKALRNSSGNIAFYCVDGDPGSSHIIKNDRNNTDIIDCSQNGKSSYIITSPSDNPTPTGLLTPPAPQNASLQFKLDLPDITKTLDGLKEADTIIELYKGKTQLLTGNIELKRIDDSSFLSENIPLMIQDKGAYRLYVKVRGTVGRVFDNIILSPGSNLNCYLTKMQDCGDLFTNSDKKPLYSGDTDGDNKNSGSYNKIDSADLLILRDQYGKKADPSLGKSADFNLDAMVDQNDFEIWAKNYSQNGDVN